MQLRISKVQCATGSVAFVITQQSNNNKQVSRNPPAHDLLCHSQAYIGLQGEGMVCLLLLVVLLGAAQQCCGCPVVTACGTDHTHPVLAQHHLQDSR